MAPRDLLGFEDLQTPQQLAEAVPRPPQRSLQIRMHLLGIMAVAVADAAGVALAAFAVLPSGGWSSISAACLLAVGLFVFGDLYRRETWELDELKRITAGLALLAGILAFQTPTLAFLGFWVLSVFLVAGFRMGVRHLSWVSQWLSRHFVVVGLGVERDSFLYQVRESRAGPVRIARGAPLGVLAGLGRAGLRRWVGQVAARHGVASDQLEVVIAPAPNEIRAARRVVDWLNDLGQPYAVANTHGSLSGSRLGLLRIPGSDTVLTSVRPWVPRLTSQVLKRWVDVVATSVAIILLAPLFAMIAGWLALERGSIFFAQTRVGRDGRRFKCYKFRTMRVDAEDRLQILLDCDPVARAEWSKCQKLSRDPRVTVFGQILRQSSLDELPQLFNILRGDMSLVGPRPIVAPEVPGYAADRTYYESESFRHYERCKPGLTGLWQVAGRHRTSHLERIRLDRWYARHHSMWLDLLILAKTVRVVLLRSGG